MIEIELVSSLCETIDLTTMDDAELLAAIRTLESTYRTIQHDLSDDHRRHLSRRELETVFSLARRVAETRLRTLIASEQREEVSSSLRQNRREYFPSPAQTTSVSKLLLHAGDSGRQPK